MTTTIGNSLINLHSWPDFLTVNWLRPSVTNRPDAHRILIGFQAQTFEALNQLNAAFTDIHCYRSLYSGIDALTP
ncbi:TPA: hypothetical protein F6U86_000136 [Serratia marcescens]|nr:hypothetical protein [Serratia marcescens]HBB6715003.1 hypothetical protein [Serratia marcescens]